MRRLFALLTVLGLLVVGLAVPAGADSDARPFKGTLSGEMFWTPDGSCPIPGLRTNSTAAGHATHMGNSMMSGDHCTPAGPEYGIGDMVLAAANGDEVYLEYWGVCPPYAELPVGGVLTCTMELEVVGGTGRFTDAHGHSSGSVSIVWLGIGAPSMPAWWTWDGTIGY